MRYLLALLLIAFSGTVLAQKKILQHDDKGNWNRIRNVNIANSGDYVLYAVEKGEKDQTIQLQSTGGNQLFSHERSKGGQFSHDSKYIAFAVNAWKDSITEMKRRKVKKKVL